MEPELKKKSPAREVYEWLQTVVYVVLGMVLLFTFVIRVVAVSGPSMRETLQNDDQLLVVNGWLCGDYQKGDIVIFQKESFEDGEAIVKRVIATEGQTVDIDFGAGIVYVDGVPLDEPYIPEPTWLDEGVQFPLTVPEGGIFVMGDNRNNSKDSRHTDLGPVDTRHVIGKAVFLAIPGKSAELDRVEWNRIGFLN